MCTWPEPLDDERLPLVLAPCDDSGWFGGVTLIALDPVEVHTHATLEQACESLRDAFDAEEFRLAAALVRYDGSAEVRVYDGAHSRGPNGWSAHGTAAGAPGFDPADASGPAHASGPLLLDPVRELDRTGYESRVDATQQAILDGDVYVLNLTYRVTGTPATDPANAFRRLSRDPGSPMAALWAGGVAPCVSISPERFVSVRVAGENAERVAEIWPIKGTRPRDPDPVLDSGLAAELAADPKERAEHVMIVDMERNDLGRVCVPGTVRVDPLFEVFATPYCHQMVSRVSGQLRDDASIGELLAATFPCGSVTGAPKRAACRIIDELEVSGRGAYTGALVVSMPGRLDSSVLIRTLEYRVDGTVAWGTGCGITIDSDPAQEWCESLLKARPVTG